MSAKFVSDVFFDLDRRERVEKAREMAAEANWLAINSFNEDMRHSYLELKRHWEMLAKEFERANEDDEAGPPLSHRAANGS